MVITSIPVNPGTATVPAEHSLFDELDQHRRRGCCSCQTLGCGFGLVGMVMVVAALMALATTGLIHVPALSTLVYPQSPAPSRTVTAEPFTLDTLQSRINPTDTGKATVTVSEGQLTSLVDAEHLPSFRQAQIAVDPGLITFSGYFIDLPIGDPVIVTLSVAIDGAIGSCTLAAVDLGRLRIPPAFTRPIGGSVCALINEKLSSNRYQLTAINPVQGSLTVTIAAPDGDASSNRAADQ